MKARIQAITKRIKLNAVVNKISSGNFDEVELASLLNEKKTLASSIKTMESKSQSGICNNFEDRMEKAIDTLNESRSDGGGGKISYLTAAYQADSLIAKRRVDGLSDLIFSADSDFAVIADGNCDDAIDTAGALIVIKDFKKEVLTNRRTKQKSVKLSNFTIYCPTASSLDDTLKEAKVTIAPSAAKYPLFDHCFSIRLRALAAIAIGCDQYPGGVPKAGPAKVMGKIQALKRGKDLQDDAAKRQVEAALASWMASEAGISVEAINTFADALTYEPGNVEGEDISHIHHAPSSLDSYLKEMAGDGTEVSEGLELALCPGSCCDGSSVHRFVVGETKDALTCSSCASKVCRFCTMELESIGEDTVQLCLPCAESNAVLPGGINTNLTIAEMRRELAAASVQCNADTDPDVVENLYAEHVESERLKLFQKGDVEFPVLPSNELPKAGSMEGGGDKLKILSRFDWGNGASCLRCKDLSPDNLADMSVLFADLLVVSKRELEKKYQQDLTGVLPDMLVDFAARSRLVRYCLCILYCVNSTAVVVATYLLTQIRFYL